MMHILDIIIIFILGFVVVWMSFCVTPKTTKETKRLLPPPKETREPKTTKETKSLLPPKKPKSVLPPPKKPRAPKTTKEKKRVSPTEAKETRAPKTTKETKQVSPTEAKETCPPKQTREPKTTKKPSEPTLCPQTPKETKRVSPTPIYKTYVMNPNSYKSLVDWVKLLPIDSNTIENINCVFETEKIKFEAFTKNEFEEPQDLVDYIAMDANAAQTLWPYVSKYKTFMASDEFVFISQKNANDTNNYNVDKDDKDDKDDKGDKDDNDNKDNDREDNKETQYNDRSHSTDEQQELKEWVEDPKANVGQMTGLSNIGNTCFMNASLQLLLHTPGFTDVLLGKIESLKNKFDETNKIENTSNADCNDDTSKKVKLKLKNYDEYPNVTDRIVDGEIVQVSEKSISIQYVGLDGKKHTIAEKINSKHVKYVNVNSTSSTSDKESSSWGISLPKIATMLKMPFFGSGASQDDRRHKKQLRLSEDEYGVRTFYNEWLYTLNEIHNKKVKQEIHTYYVDSYDPTKLHDCVRKQNARFGNFEQNDAGQALLVILKGIEKTLPYSKSSKPIYDKIMEKSVFDQDYKWCLEDDIEYVKDAQKQYSNILNLNKNLVSKYFDGIEVEEHACMGCGYERRLYKQTRGMELPIIDEYVEISIYLFDNIGINCSHYSGNNNNNYNHESKPKPYKVKLPIDCSVELAKFYILLQHYNNKSKNGLISEKNKFKLVALNNFNKYGTILGNILQDNDILTRYIDQHENQYTYVMVPSVNIDVNSNSSEYNEVLSVQFKPNTLETDSIDPLSICVLNIPKLNETMKYNITYKILQEILIKKKIGYFGIKNHELTIYFNRKCCKDETVSLHLQNLSVNGNKSNYSHSIFYFWEDNDKKTDIENPILHGQKILDAWSFYQFNQNSFSKTKKIKTIEECFKVYSKQRYERNNEFEIECPNCPNGVAPIVRICKKQVIFPYILMTRLNRGGSGSHKISHKVEFKRKLHFNNQVKYSVYGISYHSGNNYGGHYVASVKCLGTNQWYFCNDSSYFKRRFSCDGAIFMAFCKD